MQKLAKGVYVESGFAGVTVGAIVAPDGIICIDTPTHPADARRWRLKLAQLSQKPIQFIINLDHHHDRVLGNQWFDAPVIAHKITSERVRQLPELFKGGLSDTGADADLAADLQGARVVAPQLTFTGRLTLVKGGREIHLVRRPACAPGAVWVELPEDRIVFTGDAVTRDVPPPMQDADLDAWLDALAKLSQPRFPAQVIVPGRGAPTDKKGLKPMEDFIKLVRRRIESLVRSHKTRAEAAMLAEDLLRRFTVPAALREHYTRRLRLGLEHLYDVAAAVPSH